MVNCLSVGEITAVLGKLLNGNKLAEAPVSTKNVTRLSATVISHFMSRLGFDFCETTFTNSSDESELEDNSSL